MNEKERQNLTWHIAKLLGWKRNWMEPVPEAGWYYVYTAPDGKDCGLPWFCGPDWPKLIEEMRKRKWYVSIEMNPDVEPPFLCLMSPPLIELPIPPALDGETLEQYTNRLTGADGTGRVPYVERRLRQCSLGYHEECSDPDGEQCKCPCHKIPRLNKVKVEGVELCIVVCMAAKQVLEQEG